MMKGDFSHSRDERNQNFAGVLHQQGRVLLDVDWNAQTAITNDWQDTAGQDIIGSGVSAVPADQPNAFKIVSAAHAGGTTDVQLQVNPGRVWADGLLARLFGEPNPDSTIPVKRLATYLTPPVQDPSFDTSTIAKDVRDAVVLEVCREEINGFQLPDLLIEPALGGPDTTERVNTAFAFRLMRLAAGDTCENIGSCLRDDFSKKGKLKVSLQPSSGGTGDCPTPAGGGYTGFEHNLYRIEIAAVDPGPAQFKWSQYGGGLVGRGHFDTASKQVTIKANLQAVVNSGLSSFYLEAVEKNPAELGHWRVTYGATATLSNDVLSLGATVFGTIPANPNPTDTTFFRLWNGIELVQNFSNAELPNHVGILLAFDAPAASNYVPGDYWTFAVRAGEVFNPDILINTEPPKGIHYHRVPLAVLTWQNAQDAEIEDCRHVFQPLTRLAGCCSYRVGDGISSWGDFDRIQEAVDSLPPDGGEVCVLPGVHTENVTIDKRRNITIKGCGLRSRVVSRAGVDGADAAPVFHVIESQNIRILSLAVEADDTGVGILLEGRPLEALVEDEGNAAPLRDIILEQLLIRAATRSAIEAEVGYEVTIRRCRVEMKDVATGWPGIFFIGEDSLIEENVFVVLDIGERGGDVVVNRLLDPDITESADAALGGLELGGQCARVRVINNMIARGIGQGIRLGSLLTIDIQTERPVIKKPKRKFDKCHPCRPGNNSIRPKDDDATTRTSSAGDLEDILIERNRIFNMGLDGIGVAGFFELEDASELVTVRGLVIIGNEIRGCLTRTLQDVPDDMLDTIGYGGIALADVEDLIIRDNFIEENGPDFREPVCGIFVLHGEGIEISRNHIINNGIKPIASNETAAGVKRGRRGGINVVFARAPLVFQQFQRGAIPGQSGVPALVVHDNIVSVPVGQALAVTALGPVSVVGNQFTSRGIVLQADSPTLFASTVMILNLGMWSDFAQLVTFSAIQKGQVFARTTASSTTALSVAPRAGTNLERLSAFFASGDVLFANNQCMLDLFETGFSFAVSSITIFSLDDVSFHGNQCNASLADDFLVTQAYMFGVSLRVSDNRFKEGVFNAFLSGVTLGMFNTTTDNQSTHCLFIRGFPHLVVDHSNTSLMALSRDDPCTAFRTNATTKATGFSTNISSVATGPVTGPINR